MARNWWDIYTQHGPDIEYICYPVLHGVPAPDTHHPRWMGRARSALEHTQDVSEMCGHMHSTWVMY